MHECYAMQILETKRETQKKKRTIVTKGRAMKHKDHVRKNRETNMALMREGFISDDKDKQEYGDNNYKRRDRDNSVIDVDETNNQPKKRKLKKI